MRLAKKPVLTLNKTFTWINSIKESADFKVKDINLDEAIDWSITNGIIHHSSNRFFKVVGVKFTYPDGNVIYQPLLEQREIGTLGFIWRKNKLIPELLVQAKIEPGNVGIVQLAPSCQATESNADRVHGGDISPFSDLFRKHKVNIISSSLQSEQGSRFLGKLNQNILATLKKDIYSTSYVHKWIPVDEVLKMLSINFLLNSDARSVLVCSDWRKLVARKPFSSHNSIFCRELSKSFKNNGLFESNTEVKKDINKLRKGIALPEIISLYNLPGYRISQYGIVSENKKPFRVKYIDVQTKYREVAHWNQPIIESSGAGKVDLICGGINGILHFLFKPTIEPGLINKVELGPSEVVEPGKKWSINKKESGKVIIQSWQSDEGGRFYQDKSLYRIVDIGKVEHQPEECMWLSLKQIRSLLNEGRWLTNEARSVLSLLLTWL